MSEPDKDEIQNHSNILTPSEEEIYEIGKELKKIMGTVGFQKYLEFKARKRLEVGNRSLEDKEHPKEYWLGYRDGATDDEEALKMLLGSYEEIREKIVAYEKEVAEVRGATLGGLGGGELA